MLTIFILSSPLYGMLIGLAAPLIQRKIEIKRSSFFSDLCFAMLGLNLFASLAVAVTESMSRAIWLFFVGVILLVMPALMTFLICPSIFRVKIDLTR